MKRGFVILFLFCLMFGLSGCSNENKEVDIEVKAYEISSIIETAGYALEIQTYSPTSHYNDYEVNRKYDLDIGVYRLYYGYVEENIEVTVVILSTVDEATLLENKMKNDTELEELYYREEQVIVITKNEGIINLFE